MFLDDKPFAMYSRVQVDNPAGTKGKLLVFTNLNADWTVLQGIVPELLESLTSSKDSEKFELTCQDMVVLSFLLVIHFVRLPPLV